MSDYELTRNNAHTTTPVAMDARAAEQWNKWLESYVDRRLDEFGKKMARTIGEAMSEYVSRRLDAFRKELAERQEMKHGEIVEMPSWLRRTG